MVTPDMWDRFFELLESGVMPKHAAVRIGRHRNWLYKLRQRNPDIAERWAKALAAGRNRRADELEAIAEKRAREGSDLMLIFMLKSLAPERFNDRYRAVQGLEKVLRLEDVPGYQQLCDGLLQALQPHPDALGDVIAFLQAMKNDGPEKQRTH